MCKFKQKVLIAVICMLLGSVVNATAEGGYTSTNLQFLHNFFHRNEPFEFEYNLHGNYFAGLNMSMELLQLRQYGQSLGFAFQRQWQQIAQSVDGTTRGLECFQQLSALAAGFGSNELSSYKYFDSWGKIPAGLLQGHFTELGHFDECVNLKKVLAENNEITGKYCFAKLPLGSQLELNIAVCMPAVCSAQEFDIFYKLLLKTLLNVNIRPETALVTESTCKTAAPPAFEPMSWFAVAVLSILAVAMVFGSLYDYLTKLMDKKPVPLLCVFSVQKNLSQLLKIVPNTKSPNVIPCLNGIRCLSLVWVIAGHSLIFKLLQPHINTFDIVPWGRSAYSMLYQQALVAVDSFFFLSGLLVSFLALREMDRNKGKLNVPMMYLHRILRLTPMVALAILIYTELYNILGQGPIWENFGNINLFCKDTWWATLLYVNNYVKPEEMCLGHTWYLSVDMQLYILSPIFLYLLYRWQKKGVAVIATLGVLLVACLFTTMMVNDYRYHTNGFFLAGPNVMTKTYYPTHLRASPWIIGLLLGYYLHNNRQKRITLSKFVVLLGWLATFALLAVVLFAWYPQAQVNATPSNKLEEALYYSLHHVAWALALSWVVFACVKGYAGPINDFLSCPLWQPFARLSYCMYLWHLYIEGINAGFVKTNTYFSSWDMSLSFWADFGWSILFSTVMYLAFEAPLVNIEKLLLPTRREKKSDNNTSQGQLIQAEQDNTKEQSAQPHGLLQAPTILITELPDKDQQSA